MVDRTPADRSPFTHRQLMLAIGLVVEGLAPANVGRRAKAVVKIALMQRMGVGNPADIASRVIATEEWRAGLFAEGERVGADPRYKPLFDTLESLVHAGLS